MDEDEDTRLIAEYPGYPVAVVPTQSSRTAELCWVNNKITLGSKPVQSQTNLRTALNPGAKLHIDKVCEHCNVEFANNALLINHLLSLFSSTKRKSLKRKKGKPQAPKQFRLSKKIKVGDKVLKRKQYSKVSKDNCKGRNQSQIEPSTSKNVHSMQQTSSTNASTSENEISKKNLKVRFSVDNDEDSGEVQKSYKCEQCNIYFGNLNMLSEHSVEHSVKKKKLDNKIPNLKAKKTTMPKIERNKPIPASNTLSCRPEIKKSISVQNKTISRRQCDTVEQTKKAVKSPSKKVTDSKPASKNRPSKKIKKVTDFNNHGSPPVKVMNSEKTELFKSNCGLHFISYKSTQKHGDVCNGCCDTPKLNCKKCGYMFSSETLRIHQSKHHNNNQINIFDVVELSQKRDSKLQCKSCTQNFKYKKSYQQHVLKCTYKIKPQNLSNQKHHNNNQINIFDVVELSQKRDSKLQCKSCTQNFKYKKSYQQHVLKCTYKIKPQNLSNQKMLYKCLQCNIYYTSQAGLKFHLQRNHLIRYAIKKCDDCDILLSNRSFKHHIQIHHKLFECELKDLTINSNEGKISSPKTQTKNTVRHSLVSKDNISLDENVTNKNLTHSAGCSTLRGDKVNEDNISIVKNLNKEIPHNPTDILPNIQYKCNKCDLHFPTNWSLNNHVSSKNCLDSNSNETEKCPKCHLLFNSENLIEHVANYHLDKFKTSNDCKISSPKNQTNKTACHSLVIKNNSSFNESMTNEILTDSAGSNIVRRDKVSESKISMTNNINKGIPNKLTNILYKCNKCKVHFPTNSAYKDHVSSKNCPDSISNETEKCPQCQLVFYTESVIEHIANQHLDKFNSSNDYIIVCNDTPETEFLTMTGNDNENAKKDHTQITKSLHNQNNNEELALLRKSFEPNVQSLTVYDKAESVKLFAEAWIRNKCTDIANFVSVDLDSYSNFLYRCHKCTLNFLNLGRLKLHESECNGDSFEWAQCPICCYSFNISSLTLHIYVHHATMELKRENFVLKSLKNSPNIACSVASDHIMSAKKQSNTKETQNLVQKDTNQTKSASFLDNSEVIDDIRKRASEAGKCTDSNTKPSDITVNDLDSSQGTKDIHLSEFKSSRAKIAWAIDSIEDSSKYYDQNSQQEFNKEVIESLKENRTPINTAVMDLPNDQIVTKTSTIVNDASNVEEKDVSQEIDSILSALNGKSMDKPNHDSILACYQTYTGEDIQINKVFEDIDSLVTSLDKNSKASKLQKKNIVLYKCNICSIHFMTSKSLQIHTFNDAHNKDLGTTCNICHLTFKKNTITRHVTNHHEKNNSRSLNYIIKTDFRCDSTTKRRKVVSDYFNDNIKKLKYAKKMINLTEKQKSSVCKVLKSSVKNKTIAKKATDSSILTQNPILQLLLTDCENEKQQVDYSTNKNLHSQHNEPNKADNLIEPKNSNPNNLEIIDISKYENPNNLPKSRTKSQDNHSSHGSKQDKIYINTGTCDQNHISQRYLNLLNKNNMGLSAIMQPPSITLNKVVSFEKIEIMNDAAENQNKNMLKNISQTTFPESTVSTAFEDANFEIRPSYENCKNVVMHTADKVNVEVSKQHEKSGRKKGDKQRDRNKFPNSDTSSIGKHTNTYQNYPVDIIDITEETINYNTVTPGTNSNKNYSAKHNIPLDMTVEKDRTAFYGWPNRRPSNSTIGASAPTNTPMALPSAPDFNLFNFLDDPFLRFLNQPFHQQSSFNNNSNHATARPIQSKMRVTKNHSVPRVPNIFDSMKSCPICKCSDRISSIKHHLKVNKGFFSCCYCARKAADLKLIDHVQICGSQVNFNTYS